VVTIETVTKDEWVEIRKEEIITYLGVQSERSLRGKSDTYLNHASGKLGVDKSKCVPTVPLQQAADFFQLSASCSVGTEVLRNGYVLSTLRKSIPQKGTYVLLSEVI
jgi:hypothetical protein